MGRSDAAFLGALRAACLGTSPEMEKETAEK